MQRKIWLVFALILLIFLVPSVNAQEITVIQYGQTFTGQVGAAQEFTFFQFSGNAGDNVTILLSSDAMDTYLQLGDAQGNLLLENDDINSSDLNSRIDYQLPVTGSYIIGVSGWTAGNYSLMLISDTVPEQPPQPQQQGGDPLPLQVGTPVTGQAVDLDNPVIYSFTGNAGDVVIIDVTSDQIDPYVVLGDAQGNVLTENDDISSNNLNSHLEYSLPASGSYLVGVLGYSPGPYTLTLTMGGAGVPSTPVAVPVGNVTTGEISDANPGVEFPIPGVPQGARITIDVMATSGDLDTYLALFFGDTLVAENDDRQQGNLNSFIEFPGAQAGDYFIVVTRYGFADGQTSGTFELAIDVSAGGGGFGPGGGQPDVVTVPNPSANGYPQLTPAAPAEWTILAYLGGDNNLEDGLLNDMNEFELAGGSDERVRVIVLMDRSSEYDTSNDNWTEVRIYEMGGDASGDHLAGFTPTVDTIHVASLGELDTSYGNNLADFLVWGITSFPARNYAVALNDHGGAWTGIVSDDSAAHGTLTIPELSQAFDAALQATGTPRFALLINDACLMSSVEVYAGLAPYFDYVVSSPEITLNPSFDMTLLTNTLRSNPNVTMPELGTALIDKYLADMRSTAPDLAELLGGAVTDLRQVDALAQSVEAFAAVVNSNPGAYASMLGQVRSNVYTYSFFLPEDQFGPATNIDVGDFMRGVMANSNDPQLTAAAQNVLTAIDNATVYSSGGTSLTNSISFYNIFFPDNGSYLAANYFDESPLMNWAQMLRNYYGSVNPGGVRAAGVGAPTPAPSLSPAAAPSLVPQVSITNVFPLETSTNFPTFISMEVVGRNISNGQFTVDQIQPDGSAIRLNTAQIITEVVVDGVVDYQNLWTPGVDDFDFTWEVTLPTVSDGTTTTNELVVTSDGVSSMAGRYRFPGSEVWQDVTVIFGDNGLAESVIARDAGGGSALAPLTPAVGGEFQSLRSAVTPDGRVNVQPGTIFTWPQGGISTSNAPAPSGQYNLGFLIEAFGGTTGFASTAVTVNNDTINPGLTGYVDDDWGFRLTHPTGWFSMSYFPDSGLLQAGNLEATEYVFVYPHYNSPDLQVIAQDVLDDFSMVSVGQFTPVTIGGRNALQFDLTYTNDAGTWNGRAFATYREDLELGLVFSAETLNGQNLDQIYEALSSNLEWFDIISVRDQDTGIWQYTFVGESDEVRLPVPRAWLPGEQGGIWTFFAPAENTNVAAVAIIDGTDANTTLNDLMNQFVANQAGFQLQGTETYFAENAQWAVALYEASGIAGRMHVTISNNRAYALWVEAPIGEAQNVTRRLFDPMLDGFTILGEE
jgi:hypothetical protein